MGWMEHKGHILWLAQYIPGRPFKINTQFQGLKQKPFVFVEEHPNVSRALPLWILSPYLSDSDFRKPWGEFIAVLSRGQEHCFHTSYLLLAFEGHIRSPGSVLLCFLFPSR